MRRFPVSFAMLQINHRLFFYPLDTTENCHGRQKRTAAKLTFCNSPLSYFLDHWSKKMIVVGMECSNQDLQRVHEYCPYHIHSGIYGDVDGRGNATVAWIVNELKPHIDRA